MSVTSQEDCFMAAVSDSEGVPNPAPHERADGFGDLDLPLPTGRRYYRQTNADVPPSSTPPPPLPLEPWTGDFDLF